MNVHSSIYAIIRLLSPREITGFSDFPFGAIWGEEREGYEQVSRAHGAKLASYSCTWRTSVNGLG